MNRRKYREIIDMEIPVPTLISVILLAMFGTYLVARQYYNPVFQVQINPSHSILELARQVEEQSRMAVDKSQPKIIYRCQDDEPKVQYFKYASDNLTSTVMATNDQCGDVDNLDAIVMVHTAAYNFRRRQLLRILANRTMTFPYRLKVVFLIGQSLNATVQIELEKENRIHGDTVVGGFLDTYQNLTLKAVMGYRWLTETCSHVPLLIKIDDDVVFDIHKFFAFWRPHRRRKKTISCNVWKGAEVNRAGKWKVEMAVFKNATYDFPYCSGYVAIVTGDLVKPLYLGAKSLKFFWIDDVFLYGMVPRTIPGVKFINVGYKMVHPKFDQFEKCRTSKGPKCRSWAALTKGEAQLHKELERLWNVTMLPDKEEGS